MTYDCTSMIAMCFLCGCYLVMIGCFMLDMPLFIRLCPYTRFMHEVVRHARAHNLLIRRVRVMCDIDRSLLIRRVRVTHVSPIDLMIRRVRVMHVLALDLLIRRVRIRCTLIPDLMIRRVKVPWESRVLFSNVSVVLRLINSFGCLVVCLNKRRSGSEDLIALLSRDPRTGIGT